MTLCYARTDLLVIWNVTTNITIDSPSPLPVVADWTSSVASVSSIETSPAGPTRLACLMRCIRIYGVSSAKPKKLKINSKLVGPFGKSCRTAKLFWICITTSWGKMDSI